MYSYLIIFSSLVLALNAADVSVKYAESVILKCGEASDRKITWFRKNSTQPLENSEKFALAENTLSINDIRTQDIASGFLCKIGETEVESFTLKSNPDFFVQEKNSQTLTEGNSAEWECKLIVGFQHNDKVEWSWFFGQQQLNNSDKYTITSDATSSVLLINKVGKTDKGEYKCAATNPQGKSEYVFVLRVKNTLAALWPFIGIIIEVAVLCVIILVFEKKCGKKSEEDDGETTQKLVGAESDAKKRPAKA